MEKETGIPKTWELILIAAIPALAFFGWAIRIIVPELFD